MVWSCMIERYLRLSRIGLIETSALYSYTRIENETIIIHS
jgi:hypothetical protein